MTLKFRMKRNVAFDLGLEDGRVFQPDLQIREIDTVAGPAPCAFFDLTKVHEFELADDQPHEVPRTKGMSEAWHNRLIDAEFDRAMKAREKNAAVRERLAAYIKDGTLELVNDELIGSTAEAAQ